MLREKESAKQNPGESHRRWFSDEYFELVRENNVVQNQLLGSQNDGEELLVELRGQTYWVK